MSFTVLGRSFSLVEFVAFCCGMSVMVVELIGARMFVPFYGNTFFVWTSIIGVIMVFMSLGYYRGGVEADRGGGFRGLTVILFKAALFTALMPFTVSIAGLFNGASLQWGPLFGALLSLALPCYYLTKVPPYCIRLISDSVASAGRTSGFIYSISTVGSIFGTFLTGFILIPYFKLSSVVFILAAFIFAISFFLNLKKKDGFLDFLMIVGLICIQLVMLPSPVEMIFPNASILFSEDTIYNSIGVFNLEKNSSSGVENFRLLMLGSLVQGGISLDSNRSFYEYTSLVQLPWLFKNDIENMLFLGNGAGVGINYIHGIYPNADIDVVDIDPKVFEAATTYFPEKEGDRIHFYSDDARVFLMRTERKYDVIFMDVYSSTEQIPFHLLTDEMMGEVENHLTDDGVYLQDVVSPVEGEGSLVLKSVLKTTVGRFRKTYVIPVEENLSTTNTVMIMSFKKQPEGGSVEEFLNQVPNPEKELLNNSIQKYILRELAVDYSDGIFLTDEYAPTERMSRPREISH